MLPQKVCAAAVGAVGGTQKVLEGQELPTLFTARIIIEFGIVAKPVIVKGLVVAAGDTADQLLPLSVEYS